MSTNDCAANSGQIGVVLFARKTLDREAIHEDSTILCRNHNDVVSSTLDILVRRITCSGIAAFAACMLFIPAGCGRDVGVPIAPIRGAVTHQGQPIADLFINFEPVEGRPSWAMTDANGNYVAHYTPDVPGVLVGECRIWVTLKPKSVEEDQQLRGGTHPRQKELEAILTKYSREGTPLRETIESGQKRLDLKLD